MGQPEFEPPDDLHFWSFVDYAITRTSRELPSIDPVAMRLILSLTRAANMLVYDLESTIHRPRGWSWAGFRVIFVIWLAGPLEGKKVAELSGMSRAAVSALVSTLERDGFVTKDRAPHDGRVVLLGLTPQGEKAITSAFRAHNVREQQWAGALSPDEQEIMIGLLEKIIAHSADFAAKQRS